MSGYPYGNPGGGYQPQYGGGNAGYPNYPQNPGFQQPPPMPSYNDNQSCASLYGTPGPMQNNSGYPPPSGPYDQYGGNQMPNAPYGMSGGAGGNFYPPPQPSGGYMPPSSYGQPPQQHGGKRPRELQTLNSTCF